MTTDFISPSALAQFRLEAETGTALLFGGDGKRLLALLDAQRAALERVVANCRDAYCTGLKRYADAGYELEPCRICSAARKLLGEE